MTGFARAHDELTQALRWLEQGKLEAAEVLLRKLLLRHPANPGANYALGLLAVKAGEIEAALPLLTRAADARPGNVRFTLALAQSLVDTGKITEALARLEALARRTPDAWDALLARGMILRRFDRIDEATMAHREAHRLAPQNPKVGLQLAETLLAARAWDDARATLQPLLKTPSDHGRQARQLNAESFLRQRRPWPALQAYLEVAAEDPSSLPAAGNIAELWRMLGEPERSVAELDRVTPLFPRDAALASNRLVSLCYPETSSAEILCAEGRDWSRRFSPPPLSDGRGRRGEPGRRLRLGYYSCDWREHVSCEFTRHLLGHHDRTRFEIFIYQDGGQSDGITQMFRAHGDHWRETWRETPENAAKTIYADNLDVLVDIPGHFGNPRVQVIAAAPAPVIIHYIGHAGTTGIGAVGWRIADEITEPAPDDARTSSERILRLPHGFFPFLGPTVQVDPNPPPALEHGYVTFGSVNSLAKISASTVRGWAQVMQANPTARFLLAREECADQAVRERIRERFLREGFPADRLDFFTTPGEFNNLRVYHHLDVALDTQPYNGFTTTCDALWMGVPVLTIPGNRYIARCGASIITHLGHPEWIAADGNSLGLVAARLASDLTQLARLRAGLRDEFRASPLGQVEKLTKDFEAAYEYAWSQSCEVSPDAGRP